MLRAKRILLILVTIGLMAAAAWFFLLILNRVSVKPLGTWAIGSPITYVVFSPDGQLLAVGTENGTIQLRQVGDSSIEHTLVGFNSEISSLAFSPDGQLLASSISDGKSPLALWRLRDGTLDTRLVEKYPAHSLAFSPDGKTLAVGSNFSKVSLWGVSERRLRKTLDGPPTWRSSPGAIQQVAFSQSGEVLIACNQDEGVSTWEVPGERPLMKTVGFANRTTSNILSAAAFAPDGETVATSYYRIFDLYIWRVHNSNHGITIEPHIGNIRSLAFSPDGELLASGGDYADAGLISLFLPDVEFPVHIWQVADGQQRAILRGHKGDVRSLAWSPDGKLLASGSEDGTVRLWQVK